MALKPLNVAALRGVGHYLNQRAASVKKKHKSEALNGQANLVMTAADHIETLERLLKRKRK